MFVDVFTTYLKYAVENKILMITMKNMKITNKTVFRGLDIDLNQIQMNQLGEQSGKCLK